MMYANRERGTIVFDGSPDVFYMAICEECDMRLPFGTPAERDDWIVDGHSWTGHMITTALEIRP